MTRSTRSESGLEMQAVRRGPNRISTERAFSISMVISGLRCTLTYVILPFAIPVLGLAPGVGPTLGLALGSVAIVANVVSLRRFWRSGHRLRKPMTVVHVGVIVLLVILIVLDLRELLA
jgi:hypothetical protein